MGGVSAGKSSLLRALVERVETAEQSAAAGKLPDGPSTSAPTAASQLPRAEGRHKAQRRAAAGGPVTAVFQASASPDGEGETRD
jgi:hypothetical protein